MSQRWLPFRWSESEAIRSSLDQIEAYPELACRQIFASMRPDDAVHRFAKEQTNERCDLCPTGLIPTFRRCHRQIFLIRPTPDTPPPVSVENQVPPVDGYPGA